MLTSQHRKQTVLAMYSQHLGYSHDALCTGFKREMLHIGITPHFLVPFEMAKMKVFRQNHPSQTSQLSKGATQESQKVEF